MAILEAIAAIPKIADALERLVGAVTTLGKEVHANRRRQKKDAVVEAAIARVLAESTDGVRRRKAKQQPKAD